MFKKLLLSLFVFFMIVSCATKKDILYYQDIKSNTQSDITYATNQIQINDILRVKIDALIPDSAKPFNMESIGSQAITAETLPVEGYLVSQDGTIVLPILGTIKVAGLSTNELQDLLVKMLNDNGYLKDANVNIRVTNGKVTVLGEVRSPGTYRFSEQNISLNQAIGYAGDLTINGKRSDVLLIRESNGIRTYIKLDLTSSSFFSSQYYYIKQNDIIIVNPNGPKIASSGYLTNIGGILGVLTFGLTVFLLLK